MKVNTINQQMINIMTVKNQGVIYDLLVIDEYINLITLQNIGDIYSIHDQIYSNFGYENIPSLFEVTNYTFEAFTDSSYDLTPQIPSTYFVSQLSFSLLLFKLQALILKYTLLRAT